MDSSAVLMWGVLFGSIGLGYLIYGKQQKKVLPLLTGLLLMGFPYFVSSAWQVVLLGSLLVALPLMVKKLNL